MAVVGLLARQAAEIDQRDANGATALHRAVRCRCSGAVRVLLRQGADPLARNGSGSTPMDLALVTSGRGGSGTAPARKAQQVIVALLSPGRQ
ncbi:MAG: ankyrin repeat domain-containing protein [Minicystis sp.]